VEVLLVSCSAGQTGLLAGPYPESGSAVGVHVQNSSMADFYAYGVPIQAGSTSGGYWYFSKVPGVYFFDIARGGTNASNAVALGRVSLRVLKYPAGDSSNRQDVTVTVTEPSAGVFSATTPDTSWIEIVSVTQLQ
jgi:hypothetical protein